MRKRLLIITMILCLVVSFCSCGSKEEPAQTDTNSDPGSTDVLPDIGDSEDEQDGLDTDVNSPGTHKGYYHEVGDTSFYTEHDINQWLSPNERDSSMYNFDIGQMLYDIWCEDGGGIIENNVGFSYTDGESWSKGLWVDVPDSDGKNTFHSITIQYEEDGAEYTTSITMYEYPKPIKDHKTEYYYIMDQYYRLIYSDLAPLVLLAVERMEENPYNDVLNDLDLGDNYYCE